MATTFFNQASLTYNGNTTTSNRVQGTLLDALNITKTAVVDNYSANDDVTYVISITNSGTTAFNNLTMVDDLGAYNATVGGAQVLVYPLSYVPNSLLFYVNGIQTTAPAVEQAIPLTLTGINIPAGANVQIIYEANVTPFAPLQTNSTINNTATFTGTGIGEGGIPAEETVTAANTAVLSISKSMSPTTVTENGQITYTFVLQNSGNTATQTTDQLIISDTFNPAITIGAVTLDGTPFTTYDYDQPTGVFTTDPNTITVPPATYTVDPATGSYIVTPGVTVLTVVGTV